MDDSRDMRRPAQQRSAAVAPNRGSANYIPPG